MNFRQKITLYLFLTVVLGSVAFAQIVEIPDPNLRQAVRETLNLPAGAPITQADMPQLTQLDARDRQITDLAGLEHATNLFSLILGYNEITDLTPIAGLVKLEHLWVWVNPISDLSPLANLTELKALDFGYCNTISDISPIANLTKLTLLQLRGNQIVDINPLKNLTQLITLRLNDNQIVDIGPLANLTQLTELHLHNNRIVDVSSLANLTNLTELLLNDNRILDDSPLANLANLERLETQNNPIFDPNSPLVDISDPNLEQAIRETINLPSDRPLLYTHVRRLTFLHAAERGITDLTGLEHVPRLKSLYLFSNPISNLSSLASLTELTTLDMGACRISDVSPLAGLTKLESLRLHWNQIEDIRPLANLTQLTVLYLNSNRIVDVSPLAALTRLESLRIQGNFIVDHSPLDGLSLTHFTYDQSCEIPSFPVEPRIADRNLPSVFAAWNWRLGNQPGLSRVEQITHHDLYFSAWFGLRFAYTEQGVSIGGHLDEARLERDEFLALNPNMVFLVAVHMRDAFHGDSPDDSPYSPYWVRDADGNPVPGWRGTYLVDFTDPGAQDLIVDQAVAVSKCGLYDGIFLDWWSETGTVLEEYRTFEAEQLARVTILQRIRAETRSDFLIIVNSNRRKLPRTGVYINGTFMESGTPGGFGGEQPQGERLEREISEIENTLRWAEQNLREPQINALEAWAIPTESLDSPTNLRWMRAFTTLNLTHSDGYSLIIKGRSPGEQWYSHEHLWYDFWDADLGRPVGPKSQLYQETEGLYIREFTNGWAVYNHSGEAQIITLPEEVQGVASGLVNTEHALPNLDGEMYLRVKPENPADVNGDGVVNILDLTLVAQGFGTDKKGADVNGDGVINVFDLVFVANQF